MTVRLRQGFGETSPKPGHISRRATAGLDAIVIGAGPAGLATSRELARSGISHRVLERGDEPGHTWANLYDSLVLHTGRHLSVPSGPVVSVRDFALSVTPRLCRLSAPLR